MVRARGLLSSVVLLVLIATSYWHFRSLLHSESGFSQKDYGPAQNQRFPPRTDSSKKPPLPSASNKRPRILCWVLTGVENHMKKAIHVKQTWGTRCDTLLFMSSEQDDLLGSIALPGVEEGHSKLWPKTQKAFQYVWEHHRDDADWFLKADDDTYVFTDNLRSFLGNYNPNEPHYFGAVFDYGNNTIVNLGGAGYVVSKEALRQFIQDSLPYPEKCYTGLRPQYKGDEDTEFGLCLQSIGILPGDTKDEKGRHRFRIGNPFKKTPDIMDNYKRWQELLSGIPERSITFHYVKPEELYVLELLTNHLKQGDS